MELILGWLGFFIGIGFTKAVIEPVAARFVREKLLKWTPKLLRFADPHLPVWLVRLSEDQIRQRLVEFLDGEGCPKEQQTAVIEEWERIYSPLANAASLHAPIFKQVASQLVQSLADEVFADDEHY